MDLPNNSNEGYIYILYNEVFQHYGDDVFKVGRAKDVIKRLQSYTTPYLQPSEIKYVSNICKDVVRAEQMIFLKLTACRLASNREFFKVNVGTIIDIIEKEVGFINENICNDQPPQTNVNKNEDIFNITDQQFDEYLNVEHKYESKFEHISQKLDILRLDAYDTNMLIKYKDIIVNKCKLEEHFRIINILKSDDYLRWTFEKSGLSRNDEYKIILLREFEKYFHINPLDVQAISKMTFKVLDNELFLNIKKAYESQKHNPKTIQEIEQLYIVMIKHVTNKDFIITKRIWHNENRGSRVYAVSDEVIKYHIELHKLLNKQNKDYHDVIRKKYSIGEV